MTNAANALWIGAAAYGPTSNLIGKEQGVAFFTKALTASDVSTLYHAGCR